MARFHEILRGDFACNAINVLTQAGVSRLSKNEVAHKCFKMFLKFGDSRLCEIILLALIRLDTIRTAAIDSFGIIIETFR